MEYSWLKRGIRKTINIELAQNHGVDDIGRDLWMSSDPALLLKQGHLELVDQDSIQKTFKYVQGWKLQNLPG